MRLWWRIRVLPYTGFLFWTGDDGLRPYERRRMARRAERTLGTPPKRTRPAHVWLSREAAANYVWEPGTVVHIADPWSQCRDVDPFTGQADQHEHGDACEGGCE